MKTNIANFSLALLALPMMLHTPLAAAQDEEESTLTSRYEELKALALEKIGWSDEADETETAEGDLDSKLDVIKEYYEESKETTTEVSKEAYEWLREDINRIGGWDYEVLSANGQDEDEIRTTLARMGAERWNLVSAVPNGDRIVFILKRPQKSYVNVLPAKDVLKLMSNEGIGEAPEAGN